MENAENIDPNQQHQQHQQHQQEDDEEDAILPIEVLGGAGNPLNGRINDKENECCFRGSFTLGDRTLRIDHPLEPAFWLEIKYNEDYSDIDELRGRVDHTAAGVRYATQDISTRDEKHYITSTAGYHNGFFVEVSKPVMILVVMRGVVEQLGHMGAELDRFL